MNRQKLLLCVLLLVLAGSIAYSFLRAPQQEHVAALTYAPGAVAPAGAKKGPAAAAKPQGGEGELKLALLEQEHPRFSGYKRNIFSPLFRDEVKPPPFKPPPLPKLPKAPVPVPVPVPQVAAPPPPPPPTPEELARQAAEAELAKFTFLGFLKKDGQKTVFLSKNNEIFLAKKGTTLGQFQVSELTDDAITIKAAAGGKELVIPLVENRALGGRRSK